MGSVRLYGATSGYLELQAPDVSPDAALVLPSDSLQPGLVHLHTESFSAVSSVSIDDVFSAAYDNYSILINGFGSAGNFGDIRFRSGGSDVTSANYNRHRLTSDTSVVVDNDASDSEFSISWIYDTDAMFVSANIFKPAQAAVTSMQLNSGRIPNPRYLSMYGAYSATTVFDGITFSAAATNTITGSLRIYGYRNN